MNRLSDQFLAGAGLAADQNRGLGRSNFADEFEDFTHRRMLANETARSIRVACLGAHPQLLDLAAQAVPEYFVGIKGFRDVVVTL
jgi:hypothetical protein